jgi:predicted  nucleic acid-binding Zn-ribbon protein
MTQTHTNNEPNAIQTAENRIEAIRTSLANGDEKIKASDLMTARNELEFQLLRQQAAEISKQKAAEADRKAHLLDLQKRLEVVAGSRKVVDSKFAEFEKSLANYLTAATTYQNNLNNVRGALREAGMHPGEQTAIINGVGPGQTFFGITVTDIRRKLEIGEVSAENVLPDQEIKPLIEASLGEYNRHF